MRKPTEKQLRIEGYIATFQRQSGRSPTLQEISDKFGYHSTNTVRSHLALLAKKGRLTRAPRKARAICLAAVAIEKHTPRSRRAEVKPRPQAQPVRGIPLVGTIPAGPLEEALPTMDEVLPVEAGLFRGELVFALRVKGDSMKDAGILPGDYAILNSQAIVSDGEVAAVYENGEATLKQVFRRPQGLLLRPANDALKERLVKPREGNDIRIMGRMVGLVRVKGGRP